MATGTNRCYRCFRSKSGCLCDDIKPFDTRARIVVLMHILEAKKERIATGRLSSLCLNNSEVIIGIDFSEDKRVNELISDSRYYPLVLYPGKESHNISEDSYQIVDLKERIPLIFVIDGTWPCAKKMMRLSGNIQQLPRICFTPSQESRFAIKQQPHQHCVSTIESIHFLLSELDKWGYEALNGKQNHLLHILDKVVQFQLDCARDPNKPSYRGKGECYTGVKKVNYKTTSRGIFYK